MKTKQTLVYGFLAVILALAFTACSKSGGGSSSGGGKSLNSATELKEYLDKQPANSPDNPIKVAMKVNDMMIEDIVKVLNKAGKYVSLDLSGSPLTAIPDEAFRNCKTLAGITIPNTVTSIGDYAFSGTGLTSITIPNSVTEIGWSAFAETGLASLIIPNSVTSIGHGAFGGCTGLTSLTIQNGVTRIGGFSGCTGLTSITIPNSVTEIDGNAFRGCTSLTSVTIPNSVTSIEPNAFHQNTNLTSVTFQGMIASNNFSNAFDGDLRNEYLAGGIGTYTTTAPVAHYGSVWTKQ